MKNIIYTKIIIEIDITTNNDSIIGLGGILRERYPARQRLAGAAIIASEGILAVGIFLLTKRINISGKIII